MPRRIISMAAVAAFAAPVVTAALTAAAGPATAAAPTIIMPLTNSCNTPVGQGTGGLALPPVPGVGKPRIVKTKGHEDYTVVVPDTNPLEIYESTVRVDFWPPGIAHSYHLPYTGGLAQAGIPQGFIAPQIQGPGPGIATLSGQYRHETGRTCAVAGSIYLPVQFILTLPPQGGG